jgi:molybdopterin-guanine dinucleotide biosynthesis protein A
MHAIYSQACLPPIQAALRDGHSQVFSFYDQVQTRKIDESELAVFDPQGMSFFNINTPEDLAFAEDFIRQKNESEDE